MFLLNTLPAGKRFFVCLYVPFSSDDQALVASSSTSGAAVASGKAGLSWTVKAQKGWSCRLSPWIEYPVHCSKSAPDCMHVATLSEHLVFETSLLQDNWPMSEHLQFLSNHAYVDVAAASKASTA